MWTLGRKVRVRGLAKSMCWVQGRDTLTLTKRLPGKTEKMLGGGGGQSNQQWEKGTLLVTSCCGHQDKATWFVYRLSLTMKKKKVHLPCLVQTEEWWTSLQPCTPCCRIQWLILVLCRRFPCTPGGINRTT